MTTDHLIELQPLRMKAIDAQLRALQALVEVLEALDIEHHEGITLGGTRSLRQQLSRACALADHAKLIVEQLTANQCEDRDGQLDRFESDAEGLIKSALLCEHFNTNDALDRFEDSRSRCNDGEKSEQAQSKEKSAANCLAAETHQYATFVSQIRALACLCRELVFEAVATRS